VQDKPVIIVNKLNNFLSQYKHIQYTNVRSKFICKPPYLGSRYSSTAGSRLRNKYCKIYTQK